MVSGMSVRLVNMMTMKDICVMSCFTIIIYLITYATCTLFFSQYTFHQERYAIPRVALFNHKINLLHNKTYDPVMFENIHRTLKMIAPYKVIFFSDDDCHRLLGELEDEWNMRALQDTYVMLLDGRIKSDMCRLAMLWRYGGFYFDNDIFLLQDLTKNILPATEFVTCKTTTLIRNTPGFFQAFVGSKPRNKVLKQALHYHTTWVSTVMMQNEMEIQRVTLGVKKPNLGTVFLRDSFIHFYGKQSTLRLERNGISHHLKAQLLMETSLGDPIVQQNYNVTMLCTECVLDHPCAFVIIDRITRDVVMKSRIRESTGQLCGVYCTLKKNCAKEKPQAINNMIEWNKFRKQSAYIMKANLRTQTNLKKTNLKNSKIKSKYGGKKYGMTSKDFYKFHHFHTVI